ncbi:MAG: hypothetical protein JWM85_114 [Acidimicrobiaceae bacterium]|nr:hypothetical protein [Acidimicrobiaceae bacterium]
MDAGKHGRGGQRRPGQRATPPAKARQASGRYTPPIPRDKRRSPRWYGLSLVVLAVLSVGLIVANYSSALPGSPSNGYTIGGVVALAIAALLATRYR